uniref:SSD domain-containing protein n=1 Tax=Elaeophora elaphi TaxID=1147741 RepID=A0A0R3RYR5_9BILA
MKSRFFSKLSALITREPTTLTVTCVMIALSVCTANFYAELKNDFRTDFSTPLSKSWSEREYYRRFYNLTFDPYTIVLFGESIDGGSMLRSDKFTAMEQEAERGLRMHLVGDGFQNRTLGSYVHFSSKPFYEAISEAIKIQSNKNALLGYPTMNLYGVNFTTRNVFRRYNNGFVGMLTYFFIFVDQEDVVSSIKRTEVEWSNKLKQSSESGVRFRLFGDEIVNNEIFMGSLGSLPYFLTGSLAMIIFIFLSILHYNQTFLQTIFLTLWTIFCPCLAGLTSVAIFSLLGRTLNSSMLITPFLVLAVGVDDAFLVLHKWFTSVELDPPSRLTSVLVEIGPSVTLTSVTNICAFVVGSFLSPYAIREFCYCSALALMLDWIFQILVFTPILLKIHSCSFNVSRKSNKRRKSPFKSYCEFLMHPITRIILLCTLIVFWVYSGYLAVRMEENFTPQKTFRSDSFLTDSLPTLENAFMEHELFPVFMKYIPNRTAELLDIVEHVHDLDCLCPNYNTWIEEYAAVYGQTNGTTESFFENIMKYLDYNPELAKNLVLRFDSNGSATVEKISFDLCIHGYGSWRDRAFIHEQIRKKMPEEMLVYAYDCTLFDIILTARETMLQSCVITSISMLVLCALFIPSARATAFVFLSIISVTAGIVGGLSAWGADMDIIVTMSLVTAIGLTIDYAAHINYHYFVTNATLPPVDRMVSSLQSITYATTQAATTTFICVLPLYFYNVYMYVTFAKTIILCAVLGLLHTIVVTPFLLLLF